MEETDASGGALFIKEIPQGAGVAICSNDDTIWKKNSRSQLAEDALRSDVPGALVAGLAYELLQALVIGGGE